MSKTKTKTSKITTKKAVKRKANGKIWLIAVDPFAGLDLQPIWSLIRPLAEKAGARLEATYILAPASFNWTGDFSGPWIKRYRPLAEEKLTASLPGDDINKVILTCKEPGVRAAVKTLTQHARKMKAEFLCLSSHARTGLERLAMGSFAETTILTSLTPIIALHPSRRVPSAIKKILLPTDLERKSEKYTLAGAELAKRFGAEVILYHKQPDPYDPLIQQGVYSLGGGWMTVQNFTDVETKDKRSKIDVLEAKVAKLGVNVRSIFDAGPSSLLEGIEKAARDSGADLISVVTHSGPWSAALLGSVARSLLRESSLPILIRR